MSGVTSNPQPSQADLRRQLAAIDRLVKADEAKNSLIPFTEFTMPTADDPDNVALSRYKAQRFHRVLAAALEEVEAGRLLRLIITFPPRHGKSELTSRRLPPWLIGRDPYRQIIFGTYNQPFADTFGKKVRSVMERPQYRTVFPDCRLQTGHKGTNSLGTEDGGEINFVGRGGSSTGRGADFLIIDDPFKDRAEAQSPVIREQVWAWFQDTMTSRLMSDTGAIVIIQTRWHEDDLVGRLTDESNPHYNEEEAKQWKVINFRALAGDDDILGRQPGEALWPEKFGAAYLEQKRRQNPVGFAALYQQEPSPSDGAFFKAEDLVYYRDVERPSLAGLRIYAASDHAVATKQENDKTCLLIVGVDQEGIIWLLDCWWRREPSDKVVEAMIALQRKWHPLVWWAESGQITKALGPFLRKRMVETGIYLNIRKGSVASDKMTRAQSVQARSAMKMVRFPRNTSWAHDARSECLRFPNARFDDFVDTLAHIGLGLDAMPSARRPRAANNNNAPRPGTLGWVKHQSDIDARARKRRIAMGGM